MEDFKFDVKPGKELTKKEIQKINAAKTHEWDILPMDGNHLNQTLFALLKDKNSNIIAQGELLPLDNVIFMDNSYSLIGIGGIIANEKGQGHGKKLMEGIIDYLKEQNKAGLGFAGRDVIGFYEKSGFKSDSASLKRFVHEKDGQKITNQTEQVVFYTDSEDHFMEKVLANPDTEVLLQRDPDW